MSASPLLTLSGLVRGTLVRRPSERNRSPWVADVRLASGRTVLVHVPSLDMGGKCVEGAWPSISNALTGVRAKEISKYRFPVFPNFLGLVLGCIEAKFCK